jgi:2-phospho-L-lactate/phosphoenolpyruvate guanylyltransferase
MKLWLVIPVKPFDEGKTRLADALTPGARATLMRDLLAGVLAQVGESGLLAGTVVISRDEAALELARTLGAQALHESGSGLNAALDEARRMVMGRGAQGMLTLPADLPLLTTEDILELYDLALSGVEVAVSPSHDGGTNALLLCPPDAIEFAFGEGSFRRHLEQAIVQGRRYAIYRSETLDRDLDLPADLELVLSQG